MKELPVHWAASAVADLEAVVDFIARESPLAAERVWRRLRAAAQSLETMPRRGRTVRELAAIGVRDYRELIVPPWRILFRSSTRRVFVVAVLDSRQDLDQVLLARFSRG